MDISNSGILPCLGYMHGSALQGQTVHSAIVNHVYKKFVGAAFITAIEHLCTRTTRFFNKRILPYSRNIPKHDSFSYLSVMSDLKTEVKSSRATDTPVSGGLDDASIGALAHHFSEGSKRMIHDLLRLNTIRMTRRLPQTRVDSLPSMCCNC